MANKLSETLLGRFNDPKTKKDYKKNDYLVERNKLQYEVAKLLREECNDGWNYHQAEEAKEQQETLAACRELFDWDETYEIWVNWELDPATCETTHEVKDKKEFYEYLNQGKEIEEPDEKTISETCEYNYDVYQESDRTGYINVSNLRLKDPTLEIKHPEKFNYQVVLDIQGVEEPNDETINSFIADLVQEKELESNATWKVIKA